MQRIIQITISGQLIPIEEDAYQQLADYISSLEYQFSNEDGKDEIIQDIENRIAELFSIRLHAGAHAIDREDVQKVVDTLGRASDINQEQNNNTDKRYLPGPYTGGKKAYSESKKHHPKSRRRLFRDGHDKVLGGVCSGLAYHFDLDVTLVRLIFAILVFISFGTASLVYIVAWASIPMAKTPEERQAMAEGSAMDFDTIKHNMGQELKDLKKKGEEMSRELRDFFSKKK